MVQLQALESGGLRVDPDSAITYTLTGNLLQLPPAPQNDEKSHNTARDYRDKKSNIYNTAQRLAHSS